VVLYGGGGFKMNKWQNVCIRSAKHNVSCDSTTSGMCSTSVKMAISALDKISLKY
jgi:hypothetical protein